MSNDESLVEYGYKRVITTILAVLCTLLEIIDTTIVNVALNDMKGSLGVSYNDVSWVITGYAIANVIVIPMTGWLGQQFGRKNYFTASILIFTVASFFCGNSTNLWELVAFRFIQGLGGGALMTTSQTIITEIYPLAKRGMAQAIYGLGIIVGPTLGPPLGGYIIDHFSWPDIFYINIPLGIIAAILSMKYVKSPSFGGKLRLSQVDWLGIFLLAVWVSTLQFILEHGQQNDWFNSNLILSLAIVCFFGLILFIWRELVYKYPIVNLYVLRDKNLKIGIILMFIIGFGLYGSTYIIPIYTQSILGWPATDAGLLLVPSSIMAGIMMPVVGKLMQKGVSSKGLLIAGFFLFFLSCYLCNTIITTYTAYGNFFWPLIIRGIGLGFLFVPITTVSLSTLKGRDIGEGTALTGMLRQLGGSFGIAIINTLVTRLTDKHRVDLVSNLNLSNLNLQQRFHQLKLYFMNKGFASNIAEKEAYKLLDSSVLEQSTILSYMDVFLFLGGIFLLCIPFMFFIKVNKSAKVVMGH